MRPAATEDMGKGPRTERERIPDEMGKAMQSIAPRTGSDNQSATQQASDDGEDGKEAATEAGTAHQHGLPPDVNMGDLTAGERAALITVRRRRVSAIQRVADRLADQAAEESRAAERAEQRRHEEVLTEMRAG
ncbi:UNVERIFIED_CONTAM: hypothetical protein K2H54_003234 [Gekko kuhli]